MVLLAVHLVILFFSSFKVCGCKGAEKVIRAVEGASVQLPCHSPFEGSAHVSVKWKINAKSNSSCKWIIRNNSICPLFPAKDCFPHLTITTNNFSLKIENVQPSDSGNYSCKISRMIPPPTLDSSSSLILQVAGLSLKQLSIVNDSCIRLLCFLEKPNPDLANFTWSRKGQILPLESTFKANESELHLCKTGWSEGDTVNCNVNYAKSQSQKSIKLICSECASKADQDFPVVFVALLSIFIICISFIWIFFFFCDTKLRPAAMDHQNQKKNEKHTRQ